MSRIAARSLRVYLDEHKISGYLNTADLSVDQELPVVTSFEDDGPRVIAANYDYKSSIAGFGDYDDDLIDELTALVGDGDDHYLGLFPLSTSGIPTENTIAYEQVVMKASRPQSFKVGNAATFSLDAQGNSELTRATVLRSASVTGTGNGTGRNLGATAAGDKLRIVFRVIGGTFTSLTLKVQESSDDAGSDAYADITGATSGSLTAPGVVKVDIVIATEAYKRVSVSAFSGTNAIVLVTAGVVAG